MSILSSTNTGRKGIRIDEKILNSYGYNNYSVIKYNTKIHTIHFCKNDKFIWCKTYNDKIEYGINLMVDYNIFKTGDFKILTIDDLILVDKFLFAKNQKEYCKYKKQILRIHAKRLGVNLT